MFERSSPGVISPVGTRSEQRESRQVSRRGGSNGTRDLRHRERLVLSLQLRGMKQVHIAKILGCTEQAIYFITSTPHYCAAFDAALDKVDGEFAKLKPKALGALEAGLDSDDTNTGLRAAELWFKSMGYKGFGQGGGETGPRLTAEDIAAQLLAAGGGTVTIAVSPSEARGGDVTEQKAQGQGTSLEVEDAA